MPIYEYKCDCGKAIKERMLPMKECSLPQFCECGKVLQRIFSLAAVQPLSSSLLFTKDGKGARAREMALETLNKDTKHGGMPDRPWKRRAEQSAYSGL